MSSRVALLIAALALFVAVAAGAFGAHTLAKQVGPERIAVWQTAVREKLLAAGVDPLGLSTADAVKFFAREKATYSRIAKARNIKADD